MSDDVSNPPQALIVRPAVLPSIAQFGIERDLAIRLASARGFLPDHYFTGDGRERAAKVLAAIEYGRAVGIEPMIALQNITMIKGKAGASALLIGAQLRRAGYEIATAWYDQAGTIVEKRAPNVWGCEIKLTKNGKVTGDGAFSLTDAQRAGLIKEDSGWSKYPKDMLYARALTQAAREGAQDAVLGMAYTADELGVDVDYDGTADTLKMPAGLDPWETTTNGAVIDGQVVDVAPGVPEATAGNQTIPTATAIQPASPAPSEGAPAAEVVSETSTDVAPPAPPQTPSSAPVAPLSGQAFSRRMGAGRSIGPTARRTNTVTVDAQGATAPATAPEAPMPPTAQADPVPSQPAPPALTDEPDLAEPVDLGKQVYLNDLRGALRLQTATLLRVNALLDNVKRGLEGQEPNEVPPATPSEASDAALAGRIDTDWPGRKLENLGESELSALMERFDANLAKKREVLKERGISEE